jgi:hypothetical protein
MKYQDKFSIPNVNFSDRKDALIDYDQFLASEKNQDRMQAFKESYKNLNNFKNFNGTRSKSQFEEDTDRKVDEMYN